MRKLVGFLSGVVLVAVLAWGMEASADTHAYEAWTTSATVAAAWEGTTWTYSPDPYAWASCGEGIVATGASDAEARDNLNLAVEAACAPGLTITADRTWDDHSEQWSLTVWYHDAFQSRVSVVGSSSRNIQWTFQSGPAGSGPQPSKDCSPFTDWHVRRPYSVGSVGTTGATANWNGCEIVSTGRDLCREFNGVMECESQWRMTGAEYGGTDAPVEEPGAGEDPTGDDAPLCLEGDGRAVCMLDHPDNCGSYNGEAYCVEEQDQPGCQSTQSGAIICLTDGSSPPPDQPTSDFGTPKQPADEWLHPDPAGDAQELWGYPYGGGGTSAGDDGTGSDGSGGDSADGSTCLGGVEVCDGEGDGDGEGPVLEEVCPEGVDCDAGAGFGALLTTIQTEGIIAEASGLSLPSGAGACPPIAFDTELTGALSTDVHCTVANDNAGLMSAAMKAVWVMVALFVLLSG